MKKNELYLYEILNGYAGESYVRVYVISNNDKSALELATQAFAADSNCTDEGFDFPEAL